MARKAVIDIGSNSVKFYIAEKISDGRIKTVLDTDEVARLGDGLNKEGKITPEAMERNVEAVCSFYKKAQEAGCDEIAAVGTMALRSASNSSEFLKRIKENCSLEVRIIPGEEEARLSYLAVTQGFTMDSDTLVFDTGGGSTEFIFGKGDKIEKRFSINLGAVRISERYLTSDPVKEEEAVRASLEVRKELIDAGLKLQKVKLIGIGGTVTTMGAVKEGIDIYDSEKIHGLSLTLEDMNKQIELYKGKTLARRKLIKGLHPKRADVVLGGALIVKNITEILGVSYLTVSDRGLRHGLMYELFNR